MDRTLIIITGERGVGKTTSLHYWLSEYEKRGLRFSGFRTFFDHEKRHLTITGTGDMTIKAHMAEKIFEKPVLIPDLAVMDQTGQELMRLDWQNQGFMADEIGFLETLSLKMQEGILCALRNARFSIITLRLGDYPFHRRIKALKGTSVIRFRETNRSNCNEILSSHIRYGVFTTLNKI